MPCQRSGCRNIMCDRYSHKYGYLCDDCFDELVLLGENADIELFLSGALYLQPKNGYEKWNEEFSLR